jgi:hypothetical protein
MGSYLTYIMLWRFYIAHISLCSAYFCFKTKIGTMHFDGSHVTFCSVQKLTFFGSIFCVTIMLSVSHDYYIK